MSTRAWEQPDFLDKMRLVGDPPTDAVIEALAQQNGPRAVSDLIVTLMEGEGPPRLTGSLASYFNQLPLIPAAHKQSVKAGQQLFELYGLEILLLLACYSLPECYAAANGVQVVFRSGFLRDRANRRLFQTAQMLMNMLSTGGLEPNGSGCLTARKIRMLHAANRFLLRNDPSWDRNKLGLPLNQEDQAGTFTAFTVVILDGLDKFRLGISDVEAEAYLSVWREIAVILGIDDQLIPGNVADAVHLMVTIRERQFRRSSEGVQMTRALLEVLRRQSPFFLPRLPAATMRLMVGGDTAKKLDVPATAFEAWLVGVGISVGHLIDQVLGGRQRRLAYRRFGMNLLIAFIDANLDREGPRINVPDQFREKWALPQAYR